MHNFSEARLPLSFEVPEEARPPPPPPLSFHRAVAFSFFYLHLVAIVLSSGPESNYQLPTLVKCAYKHLWDDREQDAVEKNSWFLDHGGLGSPLGNAEVSPCLFCSVADGDGLRRWRAAWCQPAVLQGTPFLTAAAVYQSVLGMQFLTAFLTPRFLAPNTTINF